MSNNENSPSPGEPSRKRSGSALHMGPRKKFFALCNYPVLLTAGILRLEELQDSPIENFPAEVFTELVDSYPSLLDRLTNDEEEHVLHVGELFGKGAPGAQGDDTKTLKSTVLKWLVTGVFLCPAGLDWLNAETKRSLKSGEIAVCGDQWPIFLYAGSVYDAEDPWKGLLRSEMLSGFKHVIMSPSLVDKEPKAMRSGNAYLHGMKSMTKGSLAYIAMQIRFSLSSSSVFSRTDTVTDSENIYHSILDLLEDPDESEEVGDLMTWWTRFVIHSINLKLQVNIMYSQIFPNSSSSQRSISKNSALAKIRENALPFKDEPLILLINSLLS
ncbi:hypothetical protein F4604DRAFT_1882483 [Suillus subluteus]|nr:hypothetical protein F4604DRAFT_1882483 [Suillus subluteus]